MKLADLVADLKSAVHQLPKSWQAGAHFVADLVSGTVCTCAIYGTTFVVNWAGNACVKNIHLIGFDVAAKFLEYFLLVVGVFAFMIFVVKITLRFCREV